MDQPGQQGPEQRQAAGGDLDLPHDLQRRLAVDLGRQVGGLPTVEAALEHIGGAVDAGIGIDDADPDGPGLGIARFIREPFDTYAAEAAVTVAQDQRGRGIGTALLAALAARAVREGVTELRNYVLVENVTMRKVFEDLGARTSLEGATVLRIDLPTSGPLRSDSDAARVFRNIAAVE